MEQPKLKKITELQSLLQKEIEEGAVSQQALYDAFLNLYAHNQTLETIAKVTLTREGLEQALSDLDEERQATIRLLTDNPELVPIDRWANVTPKKQ